MIIYRFLPWGLANVRDGPVLVFYHFLASLKPVSSLFFKKRLKKKDKNSHHAYSTDLWWKLIGFKDVNPIVIR